MEQTNPSPTGKEPGSSGAKKPPIAAFALVIILFFSVLTVYWVFKSRQNNPTPVKSPLTLDQTATPSAAADPTADWRTYANRKYNFIFKFPAEYAVKTTEDLTDTEPYEVNVYSESDADKALLSFRLEKSKANALADHGEIKTEEPGEMPGIPIGGRNYPITKYLFAEGAPSGYKDCFSSNSSTRYLTEINEDLLAEINKRESIECQPDGTQRITKSTSGTELETARQILSTFRFLE